MPLLPHAAITATGSDTPGQVLDNDELVRRYGLKVDDAWIVERTGIRRRHWLDEGETTSDMAVRAARRCLQQAGIGPAQVDRLIVATISPDVPVPSTATIVARKLGARCMAFDLAAACSGFLYGLGLAAEAVRSGGARRVLVIGADARSRYLDPADHRSMVLFSDGAGCALVEAAAAPGLLGWSADADCSGMNGTHIPAGGAQRPASAQTVAAGEHYLRVDGKAEIFDIFVRLVRESCARALDHAGLGPQDIDLFIPHQGNARLVELSAQALGFAPQRVLNDVALHGNTAGATLAIALDEARRDGRIHAGSRVLLAAAGAGVTCAAAVLRF